MAQKPKNLLNVMFGAFIHAERKRQFSNLGVSELAKDYLKMSVSLYKMTEAGLVSFNINRVLNLMETFRDSDLIFDRLLKFISTQNIIDNIIVSQKLSPKQAFADLAKIDAEFRLLYSNTEKYFDYEDDSKIQKEFVETIGVDEVRAFLQNYEYVSKKGSEKSKSDANTLILKKIENVPSLSISLLLDFIKSYSNIIPLHFGKLAADWEDQNKSNIEAVYGYYEYPEMIVSKSNFAEFQHSHLLDEKFKEAQYLFGSSEKYKDALAIKKDYKELLNKARKEKGLTEIPDKVFANKLNIKILKHKDDSSLKEVVRNPHNPAEFLQAFWYFKMKAKDETIGFSGVSGHNVNVIYNLSYGAMITRTQKFESLWNSIK